MFNSIYTDLVCPIKKQVNRNAEIQIKWQDKNARNLNVYHIGDFLENIENEYNDTWIRTDYICDSCSKHTMGHKGISFIKTADQKRHYIFVKIVGTLHISTKVVDSLKKKKLSDSKNYQR